MSARVARARTTVLVGGMAALCSPTLLWGGRAFATNCVSFREWTLTLVSITCTEDGSPCDTADPDVAEALDEWRSEGSMTSGPSGSLRLDVRDDGTFSASLSTPGAE